MTDRVSAVHARRVWDSRARPTVEVEVRTEGGASARASAPAGASKGSGEAVDLRDGGERLGGFDVRRAVEAIRSRIAPALIGRDVADQTGADLLLEQLDGTDNFSRLGGNAAIAVSLALASAAAASSGEPLWRHLATDGAGAMPLPEIQIFGGGAHAGHRIDIQDLMVVCIGAPDIEAALDWTGDIYRVAGQLMEAKGRKAGVADEGGHWPLFETNEEAIECLVAAIEQAGFAPGDDVGISLDIAASDFGRDGQYRLAREGRVLTTQGMIGMLLGWLDRYPIVMIEDPLAEDDLEGLAEFTRAAGDKVQVVADDAVVTDAARIGDAAARGACNAALIKPNQTGTLTRARAALRSTRENGWGAIASARSGETEDVSIVHLAVGLGIGQLKVGSIARSERTAKWNECLRLAEILPSGGLFPPRASFPWGT